MGRRKRSSHEASPDTTRGRGDLLEDIVETMHGFPGATVERNVFLPSVRHPTRKREIDVLVSGSIGGYKVQIPIECRNVNSPIEIKEIGEFADRLEDVGLPIRLGVFVTSSRFRSGALSRARELGIQTLQYKNVESGLPEAVSQAIQSVVFTLLTITRIEISNDVGGSASAGDTLFFRGEDRSLKGSVPDLVWKQWREGGIDNALGDCCTEIVLPPNWHQFIRGQRANVQRIRVNYQVTAQVVEFPGSLDQHQLVDQLSGQVKRFYAQATFDPPEGRYPVRTYSTEEALKSGLEGRAPLRISIGRQRLPRIRFASIYWPPSQRALQALLTHLKTTMARGEEFDVSKLRIEEIEGADLKAVWEPIVPDHPMLGELGLAE